MSLFKRAKRESRKLKVALDGVSGGGKTYTAQRLAFSLVKAGMASRVAVIDTENESASLYEGECPDGVPFEFDTMNLKTFGPQDFTHALKAAFKEGYDCVIIDSLSHAWVGKGGALDLVDAKGGNSFTAWKDITPLQREMVNTIVNAPAHVIATMRSKTEYVIEEDAKGKKVPRKIGMAPVQRDGMEYEFDLYGSLDQSGQFRISKSRCPAMTGATTFKPGFPFWSPLFDWMQSAPAASPRPEAAEPSEGLGATGKADAPSLSDATYSDLLARLGMAATQSEVKSTGLAKEISDAHKAGRIDDASKAHLGKAFLALPAG